MSYAWVPAGAIPCGIVSAWIYIRYEKNDVTTAVPIAESRTNPDGLTIIKCPDRTLAIAFNPRSRPMDGTYDECVVTDIYRNEGLGEKHLGGYALISAHHGLVPSIHASSRWFITSKKLKLIGDSGGAQLKLGTASYVDPHKVIGWHNKVVDIGACLDVPPRPIDHNNQNVLNALAEVQRRNNVIFQRERRSDLKLLNVMHGYTLTQQREWGKRVQTDGEYWGWAAGADNYGSDFSNLRGIIVAAQEFSGGEWNNKGNHFHLFGVSGRKRVPAVAWVGKFIPTVTTDSTSYLTGVRTRSMVMTMPDGNFGKMDMGEKCEFKYTLNGGLTLPCTCEVCHAVKYWDVFSIPANYGTSALLAWHNMVATSAYTKFWNHLAQTLTLEEYCDVIEQMFSRVRGASKLITDMVRYVDCCFNESLDVAEKRFEPAMGNQPVSIGKMRALFLPTGASGERLQSVATNLTQRGSAAEDTLHNYMTEEEMIAWGVKAASVVEEPQLQAVIPDEIPEYQTDILEDAQTIESESTDTQAIEAIDAAAVEAFEAETPVAGTPE